MANLDSSAVTINRSWTEGGVSGKEIACRQVTLVLTGQGTAANKIPVAALLLSKLEQAECGVLSDDSAGIIATPDYAGANLLLVDINNGSAPDDITGTLRLVVKGQPA